MEDGFKGKQLSGQCGRIQEPTGTMLGHCRAAAGCRGLPDLGENPSNTPSPDPRGWEQHAAGNASALPN